MPKWFNFISKNKGWLGKETLGFLTTIFAYTWVEKNLIGAALTKGLSMEPTLHDSDVVLVDRFFYKHFFRWKLKMNDIVVARCVVQPEDMICKRITGMEGDYRTIHFSLPKKSN